MNLYSSLADSDAYYVHIYLIRCLTMSRHEFYLTEDCHILSIPSRSYNEGLIVRNTELCKEIGRRCYLLSPDLYREDANYHLLGTVRSPRAIKVNIYEVVDNCKRSPGDSSYSIFKMLMGKIFVTVLVYFIELLPSAFL